MSIVALAEAVRDHLQTVLSAALSTTIDADSCEIGFDGQPKPSCGEKYFAIHSLGWQGPNGDYDLSEEYTLGVTITLRIAWAPEDRYGVAVWAQATSGLDPLARTIITALHHNQNVRISASAKLDGGRYFVTPLQFMRAEQPRLQGPGWFLVSQEPDEPPNTADLGVSQTLVFGKCQRVQAIDEME